MVWRSVAAAVVSTALLACEDDTTAAPSPLDRHAADLVYLLPTHDPEIRHTVDESTSTIEILVMRGSAEDLAEIACRLGMDMFSAFAGWTMVAKNETTGEEHRCQVKKASTGPFRLLSTDFNEGAVTGPGSMMPSKEPSGSRFEAQLSPSERFIRCGNIVSRQLDGESAVFIVPERDFQDMIRQCMVASIQTRTEQ
jgi:hypothetical protein